MRKTVHKILTGYISLVEMSSTACLIRLKDKRILVDTGSVEERDNLLRGLGKLAVTPLDIDVVVNTHLHMDHCWNNALFPNAHHFCSTKELDGLLDAVTLMNSKVGMDEIIRNHLFISEGVPKVLERRVRRFFYEDRIFEKIVRMKRVSESALNDLGLQILETPGHTDGHVAFTLDVKAQGLRYFFLGDSLINKDHYGQKQKAVLFTKDTHQYYITKERIERHRGVFVPGHGEEFHT